MTEQVVVSINLRGDYEVTLEYPKDLTAAEAKKICTIIIGLPISVKVARLMLGEED